MMKRILYSAGSFVCLNLVLSLCVQAQVSRDPVARAKYYTEQLKREMVIADSLNRLVTDSFTRAGGDLNHVSSSNPGKLLYAALLSSDLAMDLSDSVNDKKSLGELYLKRSALEAMRGNYEQAHRFYLTGWNISDSVNSQQKKNDLADLKGKQELETKNKELALNNLQASVQRRALLGLAIAIALLSLIGFLLFRENRRRKKTSTTLLVLNSQLEEANRVKARFFGILSHDLRSPIANLLGFLHLVKTEPDILSATEKDEHSGDISRSAEQLLETMEAMLLWSKEQMDSFKPDLRKIPVNDLFDYLQKFFGREKTVAITFVNPENLVVCGDENYLRVIMQNLTSNALKALKMSQHGYIEWKAISKDGETVLSISDNGPGMNKEQAKGLYNESSGVNARAGFGFHLIRDLAKAIRFTILINSEPGKGTCFMLQYTGSVKQINETVPG